MLPALEFPLGKDAKGLSANSICRLKERWYAEYEQWRKRDLSRRRYVYVWADGVYCHVRWTISSAYSSSWVSDDTGRKEVLGVLEDIENQKQAGQNSLSSYEHCDYS